MKSSPQRSGPTKLFFYGNELDANGWNLTGSGHQR
jgi:hypothetical protein